MAIDSNNQLTKYVNAVTIVTAAVANSWYGGLYGSAEGDALSADDPCVAGHVHDGVHADGHAQKINLVSHVTGQLMNANLADNSVNVRNMQSFLDRASAIPVSEMIGGQEYFYLDLSTSSFSLDGVLAVGNETSGNNIVVDDNDYIYFGTSNDFESRFDTAFNALTIAGVHKTGVAASSDTPAASLSTGNSTITDPAVGGLTGSIVLLTGLGDSNPGGTSPETGSISILTGNSVGSTFGSGGTSANSGVIQIRTGRSDDVDSGDIDIVSGDSPNGTSGEIDFDTGDGTDSGGFIFNAGTASTGNSGGFSFTGGSSTSGNSSNVSFTTGAAASGSSGDIDLTTGNAGSTGDITIKTGVHTDAGVTHGLINIQTGAVGGTLVSGSILMESGQATGGTARSGSVKVASGDSAGTESGTVEVSSGDCSTGGTGTLTLKSGNSTVAAADSGDVTLVSGTTLTGGTTGSLIIGSGDDSGAGITGNVNIDSGDAVNGTTGILRLASGQDSGGGTTGNVTLQSGPSVGAGSGVTGNVTVTSGVDIDAGTTGDLTLGTGNASGAGTTGDIHIQTGTVGGATGTRGVVIRSAGTHDFSHRNEICVFDDFLYQNGFTVADKPWILTSGTDPQALDPDVPATQQTGGVILLTSGDAGTGVAADGSQMFLAIPVRADAGGVVFETRLHINTAVTDVVVNAGFTDQNSAVELAATLTAGDAVTFVATDAVVFVYDTTAATDEWFSAGVENGVAATGNGATGTAPVADTYQTLRLELAADGTAATFFIDGTQVDQITNAVTETVDLYATICISSNNAATHTADVDYIYVASNR